MNTNPKTRYFLAFTKDDKVTELHVLYSDDQVKVFTAIARNKGCKVEVFGIEIQEKELSNNTITVKNITETKKKDWSKTIRCVETGKIYATIRECSNQTGIPYMTIYNCINNKNATRGLHFVLHDGDIPDIIRKKKEELYSSLYANKKRTTKKTLCLNDGRMFNSVQEVLTEYHLSSNTFYHNMRLGKPINGLRFQYV